MALTVEIYNSAAWQDLSDYVLSSSKIPYIFRNRDYETIAPIITMTLSQATALLNKGDKVRIKSGATVIFSGHVLTKKDDAARKVWRIEISSALYLLRDYKCNYGTLHADISTTGDDYEDYAPAAGEPEGYPNVRVLFLLERMFVTAGLTLDVSGIEDDVYFTTIFQAVSYSVLMKDIKIDEQALYGLNQSLVGKYAPGVLSPDKSLEISFLDFLQKVCSAMGLFVHVTADLAFILYNSSIGELYTIADDDKYDYSSEDVTARVADYSFQQYFGATLAVNYRTEYNAGGAGNAVVLQYEQGDGNESLSWINHLFFLVRSKPTPTISTATHSAGTVTIVLAEDLDGINNGDYVIIADAEGMTDLNGQWLISNVQNEDTFDIILTTAQVYTVGTGNCRFAGNVYLNYSVTNLIEKKIREATQDYTEEKIMTAIDVTVKGVVENLIDIETQTSNIIQETYGLGDPV